MSTLATFALGSVDVTGLVAIIAFVVALFKISHAAWQGNLSRISYLFLALAAAALGGGAIVLVQRFPDAWFVPVLGSVVIALAGVVGGSFLGIIFFRRRSVPKPD